MKFTFFKNRFSAKPATASGGSSDGEVSTSGGQKSGSGKRRNGKKRPGSGNNPQNRRPKPAGSPDFNGKPTRFEGAETPASRPDQRKKKRPARSTDRPAASDNQRRDGGRSNNGRGRSRGKGKGKQMLQLLDPENLVKKAKPVAPEKPYEAPRSFNEFPIDATLKRALHNRGFKVPTEIQERSIEAVLEGHNVLGIANTGTGKTAAFLLPILNNLLERPQHFHALVLVPTRELALQVFEEYNAFTKDIQLFAQKFIGGTSVNEDMRRLRKRPHVVIGTPGRIADLVDRGALPMDKFEVLVLDEFDRMLDMGFSQEVQRLVGQMTRRKQSLLFSATIDNGLQRLIDELVPESVKIQVSSGTTSSETIDQDVVRVGSNENKLDTLVAMLQHEDFTRVMVFAETKHRVSRLCRDLKKAGVRADEIHGDKSQNARQIALDKFKKGYVQVLCATDVAARGIDVDNVSHVINFEVPRTYDSYIHRIGRTGRAGKTGKALTFVEK